MNQVNNCKCVCAREEEYDRLVFHVSGFALVLMVFFIIEMIYRLVDYCFFIYQYIYLNEALFLGLIGFMLGILQITTMLIAGNFLFINHIDQILARRKLQNEI